MINSVIEMRKDRKILVAGLFFLVLYFWLLPQKQTASAIYGYDLQIVSSRICYNSERIIQPGFYLGNYRFRFRIKNNGTQISPASSIALFLGDRIGFYGYPSVLTFPYPQIKGGSYVDLNQTITAVRDNFLYASIDQTDDNSANDEVYRLNFVGSCSSR